MNQSETKTISSWDKALERLSAARDNIVVKAGLGTGTGAKNPHTDIDSSKAANETDSAIPARSERNASGLPEKQENIRNETLNESTSSSRSDAKKASSSKSYVTIPVKSSHSSSSKSKITSRSSSSSSDTSSSNKSLQEGDRNLNTTTSENTLSRGSSASEIVGGLLSQPVYGDNLSTNNSTSIPSGSLTMNGSIATSPIGDENDDVTEENNSSMMIAKTASESASASGNLQDQSSVLSLQEAGNPTLASGDEAHGVAMDDTSAPAQEPAEESLQSTSDAGDAVSGVPDQSREAESSTAVSRNRPERNTVRPSQPSRPQISRGTRANTASEEIDEQQIAEEEEKQISSADELVGELSASAQEPAEERLQSTSDVGDAVSGVPDQSREAESSTTVSRNRPERNTVRPSQPSRPQISRGTRTNAASEEIDEQQINEQPSAAEDDAAPSQETEASQESPRSTSSQRPQRPAAPSRPTISR